MFSRSLTNATPRLLLAASLVLGLILAGCEGARLDVNMDPDTGQGTIDIEPTNGGGNGGDGSTDGQADDGNTSDGQFDVGTAIVFATVVALLLGVMAIVLSVANRPRA